MFARVGRALRHWFTPHHTNNFRAKLLHASGILMAIGIVLGTNVSIRILGTHAPQVLGFASTITIDEVVQQTNGQRVSLGLKPLVYSDVLANAARQKAADMFAENYWAHTSPSGKSPWYWFDAVGYHYTYAGENLAKDFGDTSAMVAAWMASPTHRANMVNPHYTDIGIAVVPGSLLGSDTILVVQLFGATTTGSIAGTSTQIPAKPTPTPAPLGVPTLSLSESAPSAVPVAAISPAPAQVNVVAGAVSQFSVQKMVNLATTALFILALVLDLVIAESQSLSRRVGKNWAHIVFINVILLVTVIVNAGRIL